MQWMEQGSVVERQHWVFPYSVSFELRFLRSQVHNRINFRPLSANFRKVKKKIRPQSQGQILLGQLQVPALKLAPLVDSHADISVYAHLKWRI